jgi:ABC-type oligopeptide transport system ATPase subunit
MIYFEKVSKIYPDKSHALDSVTFSVEPKEFTTIVGHSGAGKTTLLKMLIAEDRPTHGSIFFESKNIHKLGKSEINKLRRRIEAGKEDTLSPHIEEEAPSVSLHEGFDERVYIPIGDGAAMLRSHGVLT